MKKITEPPQRKDGTCSACTGGWMCKYHQNQSAREYNKQAQMISEVSRNMRDTTISHIAAEMQLESDEAGTAFEKAERIYNVRFP